MGRASGQTAHQPRRPSSGVRPAEPMGCLPQCPHLPPGGPVEDCPAKGDVVGAAGIKTKSKLCFTAAKWGRAPHTHSAHDASSAHTPHDWLELHLLLCVGFWDIAVSHREPRDRDETTSHVHPTSSMAEGSLVQMFRYQAGASASHVRATQIAT